MSATYDFNDRVVVITGAGQGIGRVFAEAFATAGATVVVAELNAHAGDSVAARIRDNGGDALAIATDIGDEASTMALAETVTARFGRLDVLINNAGIFSTITMRPFTDIPLAEWNQVMHVNVTGVFLMSRAVVPAMRAGGLSLWGCC